MSKILNRTHLKIISCLIMVIDHVGHVIFPQISFLRLIGRVAFPIFAFFVAEGMYYTKNRRKYICTMLCVALISQIPYLLVIGIRLNIIFTFLIAMLLIVIYDNILKSNDNFIAYMIFASVLGFIFILSFLNIIEYGFWGIMLVFTLYVFKDNTKHCLLSMLVCLFMIYLGSYLSFAFSLLSIPIVLLYNGKKGKYSCKYFFYIFYPAHIIVLYLLSFIV